MPLGPRSKALFTITLCLLVAGCNTPQQRAYNKPAPIPPPQQQSQGEQTSGGPSAQNNEQQADRESGAKPSNGTAQTMPPPTEQTASAAPDCKPAQAARPDVEITEVPLDEAGNPIEPLTANRPTPSDDDCKTAASGDKNQNTQADNAAQDAQQRQHSAGSGQKAQTSEERKAAANANLDQRLAAFDELMRRAQQAAAQERQAGSGSPAGATGGFGANRDMPDARRGAGGQADTASGLGHTPDESGSTRPGDYQHTAVGPIPADLPDGRDDDIVARQLREAASKESDRVLREKLWDEYRRYKSGL